MALVGTLVTVEAPRTVKLAKSEPSSGVADAGAEPQQTPIAANARIGTDAFVTAARVLRANLDTIFITNPLRSRNQRPSPINRAAPAGNQIHFQRQPPTGSSN